jgi:hypothetical protein
MNVENQRVLASFMSDPPLRLAVNDADIRQLPLTPNRPRRKKPDCRRVCLNLANE